MYNILLNLLYIILYTILGISCSLIKKRFLLTSIIRNSPYSSK